MRISKEKMISIFIPAIILFVGIIAAFVIVFGKDTMSINETFFTNGENSNTSSIVSIEISDTHFIGGGSFIKVEADENCNIKDCTFECSEGSSIIVDGGTLTLESCDIVGDLYLDENGTTVMGNPEYGIYAINGAKVYVKNSSIKDNIKNGIRAVGSTVEITGKTIISYNIEYGVSLEDSEAKIDSEGIISGYGSAGVCLKNSTLTLKNGKIGAGTLDGETYEGCTYGVLVNSGSKFDMEGGEIVGNTTGVQNTASTHFNFKGGRIYSNKSRGVYCSGYITMTGGQIYNHKSGIDGAGIYTTTVPKLFGGEIYNNKGGNGGGVYLKEDYSGVQFGGVTIRNNEAEYGAGVYIDGNSGVEQTIPFSETTLSGNVAGVAGGAVYANFSNLIFNCNFNNNESATSGGALYLRYSSARIDGGTFDSNVSGYAGSAICFVGYNVGLSILESTVIKSNVARSGSIYLESTNETSPVKLEFYGKLEDNGADYGAGIYSINASITMKGTIDNCNATVDGGGVYLNNSSLTQQSSITNCYSGYTGGGISATGSSKVYLYNSTKIENCTTDRNGGAIYLLNSSIFSYMSDSGTGKISNCSAKNGGGVYMNNSSLLGQEDKWLNINECTAIMGGGMFVQGKSQIDKSSLSIYACEADNRGGGIYSDNSTITLGNSGYISYCSADMGGGIYINKGKTTFNYCFIENNYARCGGGVSSNDATLYFNSVSPEEYYNVCRIGGNAATQWGGGVYCAGGSITYNSASIESNRIINMLSYDYQEEGVGGGILLSNSTMTMNGGYINDNCVKSTSSDGKKYKSVSGGGVVISGSSTFRLNAGEISGNYVDIDVEESYGGNIRIGSSGTFQMYDGEISGKWDGGKQAILGGGIHSRGVAQIFGGTITGCNATYGGGIVSFGGYEIEIESEGNTYSDEFSNNALAIYGGTISANIADKGNGIIVCGPFFLWGSPLINDRVTLTIQNSDNENVTFTDLNNVYPYPESEYHTSIHVGNYSGASDDTEFTPRSQIHLEFAVATLKITDIPSVSFILTISQDNPLYV